MKRVIKQNTSELRITSNCKWLPIQYGIAPWNDKTSDESPFVESNGEQYWLDDFMGMSPIEYKEGDKLVKLEFDGMMGTSAFTSVAIKFDRQCDNVQVYYLYNH